MQASEVKAENSGGDVNYYLLDLPDPKRLPPCQVECEDIIEALGMNFAEGTVFKSLWRMCAQRKFPVKKAGDTPVRNAEKMVYYSQRVLVQQKREE